MPSKLHTDPRVAHAACFPNCEPPLLAAKNTVWVPTLFPISAVTGQLAFVEKGRLHDVAMTLRTRDLSRQSETWGTSIPVVGKDDPYGRTFGLVDIPMEADFRSSVRVYDANPFTPPLLRLREIPLWLDEQLKQYPRIRIELEPLDGEADYWAFASITHNATQHVTIVTPF